MTKERLHWVFVCCLLFGATIAWAQHSPGAPALGEVTLSMNVKGGAFQQLEMPLMANDNGSALLSIDRVNADPQWGATSNLCVLGKTDGEQVCLRFAQLTKDATVLTAIKATSREDGKTLLSSENLPGSYRIGETVKVDLRVSPEWVEFRINEGESVKQHLSFAPHILRMGCSSALCTYRLK
jgi:hypothetical protein